MIVAVYNNKGGVGKSTLTSHIGFRAIERKLPITVLDIDRQRNTMSWLSEHKNPNEPFTNGKILVSNDSRELESGSNGLTIVDCPPSFNVVSELSNIGTWLIPVDGRFSVDGLINILNELSGKRIIVVVNKAYDSKFGSAEMKQMQNLPAEIFKFPIPAQDVVRKAEMLGVAAWKVPYGMRSSTAQNLQIFADWVLDGLKSSGTYNDTERTNLKITKNARNLYAAY